MCHADAAADAVVDQESTAAAQTGCEMSSITRLKTDSRYLPRCFGKYRAIQLPEGSHGVAGDDTNSEAGRVQGIRFLDNARIGRQITRRDQANAPRSAVTSG
jgi:hypothetical protein